MSGGDGHFHSPSHSSFPGVPVHLGMGHPGTSPSHAMSHGHQMGIAQSPSHPYSTPLNQINQHQQHVTSGNSPPNNSYMTQQNSNQQQPPLTTIASAYPDPPVYVKSYTDENVARGLTPEPPKPITDGTYMMFGQSFSSDDCIVRPLESQGIRRLYPKDFDHKKELKKMNHSILVNFLDLLDVMIKCPDTPKKDEKTSDINMLFIQMHHLINELRPHQARETIRVMMASQKRQRLETSIKMEQHIAKVQESISKFLQNLPDPESPVADRSGSIRGTLDQDILRDLISQRILLSSSDTASDNQQQQRAKSTIPLKDSSAMNEMVELDSIMCNVVYDI